MTRQMDGMGRMGGEDYSVEFSPPSGLKLDGDSGRAMVTWHRKPDGRVCINTFDGVKLSESSSTEPDEDDMEGMPV